MTVRMTRREALATGAALLTAGLANAAPPEWKIATFSAEVTPPIGAPLLANLVPDATSIDDPLFANGFVLLGPDKPIVITVVDWCEIRNSSYDKWRETLAKAAGTTPSRVIVSCIHQHDAPLDDLDAHKLLTDGKLKARIIDPTFQAKVLERVGKALADALPKARKVTHLGLGAAEVKQVASNRRYLDADGKPRFDRGSASGGNKYMADAPENTIDPLLKTISFWDGDEAVAALSVYATHPMSYYRTGKVSADFPGLARKKRQADLPKVFQMYASGASGNVTAGKYNDGAAGNRPILADRLVKAMAAGWDQTKKHELKTAEVRVTPLRLEPRDHPGYTIADLKKKLSADASIIDQARGALGLAWRNRADTGHKIDMPVIDFGVAQVLLVPGESYVEFQLYAQSVRKDSFVVVMGYGECGPGYIPIERAWDERDGNLSDWCWVAPGAEKAMQAAIKDALKGK